MDNLQETRTETEVTPEVENTAEELTRAEVNVQRRAEHSHLSRARIIDIVGITLFTSVMRAASYTVFTVPNKIAPGGVAGLSSVFYNLWGWNVALTTFLFNIPLLILAFIYINKEFAILTTIAVGITSVLTELFQYIPVTFTGDLFVASVCGGMLNGLALGFLFKVNSSTGGTDIVGLLVQNWLRDVKVYWILFFCNAAVAVLAGFVFMSLELAMYSIISTFACSYAGDFIQKGFVSTVEFKIFTQEDKRAEICDYVINVMKRGISSLSSMGMYTHEERDFLICVVRKRQSSQLTNAIHTIDPQAFFYVTSVHSILGKGFEDNTTPKSKLK